MATSLSRDVEILPGVWQVRQDLAPVLIGTYTVINLLVGERLVIIDTGLPNQEERVLALIARLGRQPSDVAAIINTHGHGDHIGANVALARLTGAPVHIHRDDAFYLERGTPRWGDTSIETAPADRLLADGDVLAYGDQRLEVIHLPGHSPGSVGLYDRERRILYCGDAIQGRGTVVQHLPLYIDPDAYSRTLQRVRHLAIDHLVPDHPYLPLRDSIASGDEIDSFLADSERAYADLEPRILAAIQSRARPATLEEITLPLCQWNGFETITGMATITVRAHLDRLARAGQVVTLEEGTTTRWQVVAS